ncbi:MAG: helix-turn-helix domain-containing protein [Anaerolineales bacterium]|jgi:DNA-binding transcriptional ArsR family regulator
MMAKKTKADLILHPIRMRILMALAGSRKTSQELADDLGDVPQATLYRHINRLAKSGIIEVVEERQVRGTIEKVYTLEDTRASTLTAEDAANFSKDDHMRYFITFIASLLDDFSRYIHQSETVDLLADNVGYRKFPLELSDEELKSLSAEMNAVLAPYLENSPRQDRRRRIFSFVVMPEGSETRK